MSIDISILTSLQIGELANLVDTEFHTKIRHPDRTKLDQDAFDIKNYFYGRMNNTQFTSLDKRMIYAYAETVVLVNNTPAYSAKFKLTPLEKYIKQVTG